MAADISFAPSAPTVAGTLALVGAAFGYALFGLLSRWVSLGAGVFTQLALREVVIGLLLAAYLWQKSGGLHLRPGDITRFVWLGCLGVVSSATAFMAFNTTFIGTTLFVHYAAVILAAFALGWWYFGERLNGVRVLALLAALVGLVLIALPRGVTPALVPLLLAAASGVASAAWYALAKHLAAYYRPEQVLWAQVLVTLPVSALLAAFTERTLGSWSAGQWVAVLLFGLVALLANVLTIAGYQRLPVQVATLVLLLEVVFGVALGVVVYAEMPYPWELAGGVLVLIAAALPQLGASARES